MLMKEICKACHLTKKAVEYYEQQGLVHPTVMENGYRDYGDVELASLKEISVLRKCGLAVHDIRTILESSDKRAALSRCKYLNQLKIQKLVATQQYLDSLIIDYDIHKAFVEVQQLDDSMYTVREKLAFAFPGNYGIYLSLHFGRFLNEPLQTEEQRAAYLEIIEFLDNVTLHISDELAEYLNNTFQAMEAVGMEKFEAMSHVAIEKAVQNPADLLESEDIAAYVEYRLSDEFKNSSAGRFTEIMIEFHKNSGYQEKFIENMKRLSTDYQKYCDEMAMANKMFLEKFPEAEQFF